MKQEICKICAQEHISCSFLACRQGECGSCVVVTAGTLILAKKLDDRGAIGIALRNCDFASVFTS